MNPAASFATFSSILATTGFAITNADEKAHKERGFIEEFIDLYKSSLRNTVDSADNTICLPAL